LKQFRIDCPIREAIKLNATAYRAAWDGKFDEAERLWKHIVGKDAYPQDTAYAYALHAKFLAVLGRREEADERLKRGLAFLEVLSPSDTWSVRMVHQCRSVSAITATIIGRHNFAARLLPRGQLEDEAASALRDIASSFVIIHAGKADDSANYLAIARLIAAD